MWKHKHIKITCLVPASSETTFCDVVVKDSSNDQLVVTIDEITQQGERRTSARIPVDAWGEVYINNEKNLFSILNLSLTGMYVFVANDLYVHQELQFTLRLDSDVVEIKGTVQRAENNLYGIAFKEVDEDTLTVLHNYLARQ